LLVPFIATAQHRTLVANHNQHCAGNGHGFRQPARNDVPVRPLDVGSVLILWHER
jgi:hypothetical protein